MGTDSDSKSGHFNFKKGQEIEVSSDEEGFRGAWYVAKILESTQPQSSSSSTSKKKKKVMIEYKTLVKDDGSTLLTEHVDLNFIRPLPPDNGSKNGVVFTENESVDAGYRDGWWTGVVRKVLDGGFKYRVYFDNPPDIIDFEAKDLRRHWDWVYGNWVAPKKQNTAGSMFSSGTEVEVNIDDEKLHDGWYPAIVVKENGDNTFFVKYKISGNNDDSAVKVNVDSEHIRPAPPSYEDRNFELLEKVDGLHEFCWISGVITKFLAGRRYLVFSKQRNMQRELDHANIRPHLEWIDGQWKCENKGVVLVSDSQRQLGDVSRNNGTPNMSSKQESSGGTKAMVAETTPCSKTIKDLLEQSTNSNEKTSSNCSPPIKKIKISSVNGSGVHSSSAKKSTDEDAVDVSSSTTKETPSVETLRELATRSGNKRTRFSRKPIDSDHVAEKPESIPAEKQDVVPRSNPILIRIKELPEKSRLQKAAELKSDKVEVVIMKGRRTKSPFKNPSVSSPVDTANNISETGDGKKEAEIDLVLGLEARGSQLNGEGTLKPIKEKSLNDSAGGRPIGLYQLKYKGSSQRRKRGRPRKLVPISKMNFETGVENRGIQNGADALVANDQSNYEGGIPLEPTVDAAEERIGFETNSFTNEADMTNTTASKAVVDDDQPLSTWIGGMHSAGAEELVTFGRPSNGVIDTAGRHADIVMASTNEVTPIGNGCLPFVKKSPVWETIEAMEIFRILPQKPHFLPLADCKEEYREGSAIGIMVTFASLFDKISSLRFRDSESVLVSTLDSLLDLEKHGFDVTEPRKRVNELLAMKNGKDELINQSVEVEGNIKECTEEKKKCDAEIKDIERKINELREKLVVAKSTLESKENEISRLQLLLDSVKGRISYAEDNFERKASSPWKSTV